jgi:hypothetical protein
MCFSLLTSKLRQFRILDRAGLSWRTGDQTILLSQTSASVKLAAGARALPLVLLLYEDRTKGDVSGLS